MALESNILLSPFRTTFGLDARISDFLLGRPESAREMWVRFEGDTIHVWASSNNCETVGIHLRTRDGIPCLHTAFRPPATGKDLPEKIDIFAHDWLHLADQLEDTRSRSFGEVFLKLLRQVGGDPDHANLYELKPKSPD